MICLLLPNPHSSTRLGSERRQVSRIIFLTSLVEIIGFSYQFIYLGEWYDIIMLEKFISDSKPENSFKIKSYLFIIF